MRKLKAFGLALLALFAFGGAGLSLDTANRVEFADCSSGGSSAQTLTLAGQGNFLVTVSSAADVYLCFAGSASTCGSGGVLFPPGTVAVITVNADQKSVSCRSSTSTGDVHFTPSR